MLFDNMFEFEFGDSPVYTIDNVLEIVSNAPVSFYDLILQDARTQPNYTVPRIKKVYFNNKHTTIEWMDGEKTTVGCMEGQEFDEYSGFAAAILKRMFGSSTKALNFMNAHKVVQQDTKKKVSK